MCGLAGIVLPAGARVDLELLRAMTGTLRHRGPDDEGFYVSPEGSTGLGFRRLSIIDLDGGHQPMANEDGTVWVAFNGEIYNFAELREELVARGHRFRTRSDTEVLVHGYEVWGEAVCDRLLGMYAFALWDERQRRLFCARDPLGKKPLYYAELPGGGLVVGSEVKALRRHPGVARELDLHALGRYLVYEHVPSPHTIYRGVHKLSPGELLVYSPPAAGEAAAAGRLQRRTYFRLAFGEAGLKAAGAANGAANGAAEIGARGLDAVVTRLRSEISRAVGKRLVSDVPLGVFLSGGIDSSTVVAFMADHVPAASIRTFSITFDDPSFDEGPHARRIARALGTDHHEERLDARTMIDILPQVSAFLDEPLGDASIIPTYLLARFTRRHVTVALGGDGGDELFAGYPTFQAERLSPIYELAPAWLRALARRLVDALPVSTRNFSLDFKLRQFLRGADLRGPRRHQLWLASFTPEETAAALAPALRDELARSGDDLLGDIDTYLAGVDARDRWDRLLAFYARFYLADDVLVKVDRASMASSLEVRAPLLDRQLVDYVSRLDSRLKLHGLTTKHVLKQAVRDKLPREIWQRPKKGFGIPVARWLKRELRSLAGDLLDETRLRNAGIFEPRAVGRLWREHLAGKRDHRKPLWTLLAFELCRERWLSA